MTHPLDGCRIKLVRAEEHLDALDAEIRSFLKVDPYRVLTKTYANGAKRLYRFQRKPLPTEWPVLLGDCVHNFRCVLDHLAYQLVSTRRTPDTFTQFPICLREKDWSRTSQRQLGDVGRKGIKTAIERLQPYKGRAGANHPLWLLHRLDIIDKHRQLLPMTLLGIPTVDFSRAKRPLVGYHIVPGPYKDPADFAQILVDFGPKGPVNVDLKPPFDIEIAEVDVIEGRPKQTLPLLTTLRDVRDRVRLVLRTLDHFCD